MNSRSSSGRWTATTEWEQELWQRRFANGSVSMRLLCRKDRRGTRPPPSFFEYPSFEEPADFDPGPAQQPAPDVKALVGALTELCDEIDNHDIHSAISKTNILWFKRKARAALAPYRKGGE